MSYQETPSRESFVFYRSFYDSIKGLPEEVQLALFRAVVAYGLDQANPDFTGIPQQPFVEAIFAGIRPQLDANHKRFLNGYKGKEYGRLGGAPKGNTNASKQPQNNPKITPNVNVNVNENVKGDERGIKDGSLPMPYSDPVFVGTWNELRSQPKWKHKTVRALKMALTQLGKYPIDFAVILMETAIAGNYQGVTFTDTPVRFEQWKRAKNQPQPEHLNGRVITDIDNLYND